MNPLVKTVENRRILLGSLCRHVFSLPKRPILRRIPAVIGNSLTITSLIPSLCELECRLMEKGGIGDNLPNGDKIGIFLTYLLTYPSLFEPIGFGVQYSPHGLEVRVRECLFTRRFGNIQHYRNIARIMHIDGDEYTLNKQFALFESLFQLVAPEIMIASVEAHHEETINRYLNKRM